MSFDLVVFDPSRAPRDRPAFMEWYVEQLREPGPGEVDTSPALSAWLQEFILEFPAMNGPLATGRDHPRRTDYAVREHLILASFAWSQATAGCQAMLKSAGRHGLGVFDASTTDGAIEFPGSVTDASPAGSTVDLDAVHGFLEEHLPLWTAGFALQYMGDLGPSEDPPGHASATFRLLALDFEAPAPRITGIKEQPVPLCPLGADTDHVLAYLHETLALLERAGEDAAASEHVCWQLPGDLFHRDVFTVEDATTPEDVRALLRHPSRLGGLIPR